MKEIKIRIKGTTPLLQHRMTDEELMGLLGTKTKRNTDKEPQTPREIAEKYAYKSESGSFMVPTSYFVGAFKGVAADYKQRNSVRKSLKAVAAGIFRPTDEFVHLKNEDNSDITSFEVDIKKATNHQKGAVVVCRPRFDRWECDLNVVIDETLCSPETIQEMLEDAGKRSGIGSFRVSKGGYYGQFRITEFKEVTND